MYMIWGIAAISFVMLDAVFTQLFGIYLSLGALVAMLAGYAGFNALGQFGMHLSLLGIHMYGVVQTL